MDRHQADPHGRRLDHGPPFQVHRGAGDDPEEMGRSRHGLLERAPTGMRESRMASRDIAQSQMGGGSVLQGTSHKAGGREGRQRRSTASVEEGLQRQVEHVPHQTAGTSKTLDGGLPGLSDGKPYKEVQTRHQEVPHCLGHHGCQP